MRSICVSWTLLYTKIPFRPSRWPRSPVHFALWSERQNRTEDALVLVISTNRTYFTMNCWEEARLSGLVLGESHIGQPPLWIWKKEKEEGLPRDVVNQIPHGHAMVVVYPTDRNPKEEIVVLVGGGTDYNKRNSVLLLKDIEDERRATHWQEGPPLNQGRIFLSAVVCNGHVYAIGGHGDITSSVDTVERIGLEDLLSSSSTSSKSTFRDNGDIQKTKWETLKCRLSSPRLDSSTVVVHNRYILVVGGKSRLGDASLLSVDIIDTATSEQGSTDPCCIFSGPPLTVPRTRFGMEVVEGRVYVVGGCYSHSSHICDSVEYLDLSDSGHGVDNKITLSSKVWSGLSWTKHKELKLFDCRSDHAIVRVGSCLVVSGGTIYRGNGCVKGAGTIEILDTKRNKVWKLPLRTPCCGFRHSLVTRSNGIVAMGFVAKGSSRNEFTFYKERLPLTDKKSSLFLRLLEKPNLVETSKQV